MIALRFTLIVLVLAFFSACSGGAGGDQTANDFNPNGNDVGIDAPPTSFGDSSLASPNILVPSEAIYASNRDEILIQGECLSDNHILVFKPDGNHFTEVARTRCSDDAFEFYLPENEDGNHIYEFYQTTTSGDTSLPSIVVWQRDTLSPSSPDVISPQNMLNVSSGDLKITGECEDGGDVEISGDFGNTVTCINNVFEIIVSLAYDGLYNFRLRQSDRAGNLSEWRNLYWVRNSLTLEPPSIESPVQQVYKTREEVVRITGSCLTSAIVEIQSLQEPARIYSLTCVNGAYELIDDIEAGETKDYVIRQILNGKQSSEDWIRWTRLELEPLFEIIRSPDFENLKSYVVIVLESLESKLNLDLAFENGDYEFQDGLILIKKPLEGLNQIVLRVKEESETAPTLETVIEWLQMGRN